MGSPSSLRTTTSASSTRGSMPTSSPQQMPMAISETRHLTPDQVVSKAWALGVSSGLMIALGYPGEMLISENTHGVRFMFWAAAMVPFLYVVYTLLVGLKEAIASEGNPKVASMLTQ